MRLNIYNNGNIIEIENINLKFLKRKNSNLKEEEQVKCK